MEANPVEAVHNNAIATRGTALLAGELGVKRFVLVSTDKAVAPATVMGASKALAEFALEGAAARFPNTVYKAVRFGNVLGSSGSVVPIFRRQIARGGPVTVTDKRMTRYFMTIPEAVQLIIRAGSLLTPPALPRAAEVLVLDMGEPVRIVDLARAMIELSGLDPDRDIEIEEVGARAGEKLHEELFNSYEPARPTAAEKILLAEREPLAPEIVAAMFDEIKLLVLEGDAAGLAAKVAGLGATVRGDRAAVVRGRRRGQGARYRARVACSARTLCRRMTAPLLALSLSNTAAQGRRSGGLRGPGRDRGSLAAGLLAGAGAQTVARVGRASAGARAGARAARERGGGGARAARSQPRVGGWRAWCPEATPVTRVASARGGACRRQSRAARGPVARPGAAAGQPLRLPAAVWAPAAPAGGSAPASAAPTGQSTTPGQSSPAAQPGHGALRCRVSQPGSTDARGRRDRAAGREPPPRASAAGRPAMMPSRRGCAAARRSTPARRRAGGCRTGARRKSEQLG